MTRTYNKLNSKYQKNYKMAFIGKQKTANRLTLETEIAMYHDAYSTDSFGNIPFRNHISGVIPANPKILEGLLPNWNSKRKKKRFWITNPKHTKTMI